MVSINKLKNNKNKIKFGLCIMIIFIIVIILSFIIYYINNILTVSINNPKDISLEIPVGSSPNKIAAILKEKGLIRNEIIFKIALKKNNDEDKLKAGYFTLNTGMSLKEIIAEISKGGENKNVQIFTIPEGYELRHISEKLSDEGLVDKDEFLKLTSDKKYFEDKFSFLKELNEGQSLEGFLFPSTYEVYTNSNEKQIIEKMLLQFEQIYKKDIKENMNKMDLSLNEVVTLASIIEREAKRDDERELISAVFLNRLKIDKPLESCATVQYALGERKEVLDSKDTEIQSEYNTYIHTGLPPTPIATPGEKSLVAAVNPADVDYLYFRTKEDGTGAHTFTKTYEEHLNADPNK